MKKSELTQFTQIVEILVKREIRKQLPQILAEAFQNSSIKSREPIVEEQVEPLAVPQVVEEELPADDNETINLRQSLKEMFAGTTVMQPAHAPRTPKTYAKDPRLNAVLNETVGDLRSREGMMSMAAYQGGYSTPLSMTPTVDNAQITEGTGVSTPPISALPQGISVLDIAKQVPLDKGVKRALTMNYSEMMKKIDQKKKGRM